MTELKQTLQSIPDGTPKEVLERLIGMIKRGVDPKSACKVCGVEWRNYYTWKRRGQEIMSCIEAGAEVPFSDDPNRQEAYTNFFIEAEKAEGTFDARIDLELAKRVDKMDTRELIRMREMRASQWGTKKHTQVTHSNDPDNPMPSQITIANAQVIAFSADILKQADAALLEAGIVEAEVIDSGEE